MTNFTCFIVILQSRALSACDGLININLLLHVFVLCVFVICD